MPCNSLSGSGCMEQSDKDPPDTQDCMRHPHLEGWKPGQFLPIRQYRALEGHL